MSFNNFILVHGAMRCLTLLCSDLDDQMVPTLIPSLFPSLLTIVSSPQVVFCISFWTKLAMQKVWKEVIHYQKFTLYLYTTLSPLWRCLNFQHQKGRGHIIGIKKSFPFTYILHISCQFLFVKIFFHFVSGCFWGKIEVLSFC